MFRTVSTRLAHLTARFWLVLSLFVISDALNAAIAPHHVILALYMFPAVFAAFYGGRRYALFTAAATVVLIGAMTHVKHAVFAPAIGSTQTRIDALIWAAMLMLTAYALGVVAEQKERYVRELRDTYRGVLLVLSHFISRDSYTQTFAQDRRFVVISALTRSAPAARRDRCARLDGASDKGVDLAVPGFVDERSIINGLIDQRISKARVLHGGGEFINKLIGNTALDVDAFGAVADLAAIDDPGSFDCFDGLIDVGVGHNHGGRLSAQFKIHLGNVGGGCRHDCRPGLHAAREADQAKAW